MTTPMMQQYHDAKARHPGMILLFRMGDFYETFEEDAELIGRVLGLKVASRDKIMPMAGFPHPALETYLQKLLQAGHRVAVCDQVEDASQAKGLVKREVTRIVTPGTITEDTLLDPRKSNHLLALVPGKHPRQPHGLAWVELSTGVFWAMDVLPDRLADELQRLQAAECLIAEREIDDLDETLRGLLPRSLSPRPDWNFDPTSSRQVLHEHFNVMTMAGFGFVDSSPCLTAAGAILHYLKETLKASLAHVRRLQPFQAADYLLLDEVTRRSLELTRTSRDNSREGSLLAVIDRTVTPMGARLLHDAILTPLAKLEPIQARLNAVGELIDRHDSRRDLRELLSDVADLQRLTARVSTARANPRELAAVGRTLRLLPKLKARLSGRNALLLRELDQKLDLCVELRELIDGALSDDPPINAKDGGVIRPGHHADLDELRRLATEGKNWIARYQADEINRTGIGSLKVGYTSVFGYYIEVTHAHTSKVPSDYVRKQTLKGAERYFTPELKEYEEKVLTAQERAGTLEYDLFVQLRLQVATRTVRLLNTADVLAQVDFLAALAELAASRNYIRPQLFEEPILDIRQGRHPRVRSNVTPWHLRSQ